MQNSNSKDGTEVPTSTNAEVVTSSQTIAKPIVVRRLFLLLVKWILLKPLVNLSYVINGRMLGQPKWYERNFSMPIRNKRLNRITYQLTKYVMFG